VNQCLSPPLLAISVLLLAAPAAAAPLVENPETPPGGVQTVTPTEAWRVGGEDDEVFFGNVGRVLAGPDQTVTDSDDDGSEGVTLDGSGSSDSDGTLISYTWSTGSGQLATGVSPTVTLTVGTHPITLTVTDDEGASDSDIVTIVVEPLEMIYLYLPIVMQSSSP